MALMKRKTKNKPIFELITPDNKILLAYNTHIITPRGSILTDDDDDAILKIQKN
jgi:hypothetical protein